MLSHGTRNHIFCALVAGAFALLLATPAHAGVTFGPYASIKSTKNIKPGKKDSGTETETLKQRQEYGFRGSLKFFSLFGLQLSAGQSKLTVTEKVQIAKDDYGEMDYAKDFNMDTSNPDNEVKTIETQNNGKISAVLDPSFGPFIMRAKAGVTATQRIVTVEETGKDPITKTLGPKYKPHSGFGLGIKFSPLMYFIAEYNFEHYMFPKITPFEREVAVTFGVSI